MFFRLSTWELGLIIGGVVLGSASIYGHSDPSDFERAMEALAKSRRVDEEGPDE